MSFYEFDANSLNDSKSFTQSIVRNIVPRNGKAVVGTSMSERGFTGRTLNSPDLISAASGKYLFKNQVYENVFRANLVRENLNSLAVTILEGQLPAVEGQDAGSFAARILTQSGIGVEGNSGLLRNVSTALNSTYSNQSTGAFGVGENNVPHAFQDYNPSNGSIATRFVDVATESRLTQIQKSYYQTRGELLSRNLYISPGDKNVLINGFNFDIRDSNTTAEYDVANSKQLEATADQIERRINEGLIKSPSQKAFISAHLIECLLALASTSYGPPLKINGYNGGFGTFRQDGTTGSVPRSSGTQGNSITDHAFGRAFDIMSIYEVKSDAAERAGSPTVTKINSKKGYNHQLDVLLKKLNAMPSHLIPDYMAISSKYTDPEYDTMIESTTSIVQTKYPRLKDLKIKRDTSGSHDNHIHISFAASRGGIYTGPNGQLSTFANPQTYQNGTSGTPMPADRLERQVQFNELTKNYTGQAVALDPGIIFNGLVQYGLFTPELAACFVAISERESRRILYIVQRVYGALGLWQVSTIPDDGGMAEAFLSQPQKEKIAYWKLALPDKANENLTKDQITSLIKERCPAQGTVRIDLFDTRCWNLANQIDLVRSKMGFTGSKAPVDGLTNRVSAWGDGYWSKGWITGVKFSDASEVYTRMTRKKGRRIKNMDKKKYND